MGIVVMTCMTLKKQFETEDPEVILLRNGRYAYRAECPWKGKNDKTLYAFKFASADAYRAHQALETKSEHLSESEHEEEEP